MSEKSETNLWAIITSTYLSLVPAILYLWSLRDSIYDPVRTFPNRGIGLAGYIGMDAAAQTHRYVFLIIITIISFYSILALLNWMVQSTRLHGLSRSVRAEKQTIYGLVILQIMGAVKLSISGDPAVLKINAALLFFTLLCMALILLKLYAKVNSKVSLLHYLSIYPFLQLSFLLPIALIFAYKPFLSRRISFGNLDIGIYLLTAILLNLLFWRQTRECDSKKEKGIIKRYYVSAIPLFFLPATIPLSNEIQYSMSRFWTIDPRFFCLILIFLLCSFAVLIQYACQRPTRLSHGPQRIIAKVYLPCLVVAIVIYRFHYHTVELTDQLGQKLGRLDSFHLGEVLLPFHQWMSFAKIPFVDSWPAHGLRDFLPQSLYCLANGYQGTYDVMIWAWLNYVFAYLALYYLLSKIIDPFFSFVFLLFEPCYVFNFFGRAGFPTKNIEFAGPILISLAVLWFFRKTSFWRFTIIWLLSVFLLLWRPDIGAASLVGVLFVVGLASRQEGFGFCRKGLISFSIIYGSFFVLYILLIILRKQEFSYVATNIFYFIQTDTLISMHLFRKYNPLVILQYFLFPVIGIAYVVFSVHRLVLKRDLKPEQYALTMVAIFSLVYLIRMLHFHSMTVHGFQFLLYPFLGSMLGFHFLAKKGDGKLIFAMVFCIFILISPRANGSTLFGDGIDFKFMRWEEGSERISLSLSRPPNLVEFLNNNLSEGQTFYDLTNSSDLFVMTDKEFVPFFVGSFYYAFDDLQNAFLARFEELYRGEKIPYVLFESNTIFDKLFHIDNPYRSFRIAEFIYERYSPFRLIDGYEVWISDNLRKDMHTSKLFERRTERFDLGFLAYQWGSLDEDNASTHSPELALFIQDGRTVNREPQVFELPPQIDKSDGNYIHLRIRAKKQTTVYFGYGESPEPRFTFKVRESQEALDYIIRVSAQWEWVSSPANQVWLSAARPVFVEKGVLRRGD